jgi:L-lactate dehydrogenase complex protein LldG
MSDARSEVLHRIRGAIAGVVAAPVARTYATTGAAPAGAAAVVATFVERAVDYKATVVQCADEPAALVECIGAQLAARGIDTCLVAPGLTHLTERLAGAAADHVGIDARVLDSTPAVVTASVAAIAETGTIVLDGSPACGRRALSLVPDVHVCIVRARDVHATVPEALAVLPRTSPLTLISGPSATSDIELHRVEGVHGPRTLVIVLAGGAS